MLKVTVDVMLTQDIDQEPVVTLNSCDSLEEAKYLLEHFVLMSISKVGLDVISSYIAPHPKYSEPGFESSCPYLKSCSLFVSPIHSGV